jgi:hypothetical protein
MAKVFTKKLSILIQHNNHALISTQACICSASNLWWIFFPHKQISYGGLFNVQVCPSSKKWAVVREIPGHIGLL